MLPTRDWYPTDHSLGLVVLQQHILTWGVERGIFGGNSDHGVGPSLFVGPVQLQNMQTLAVTNLSRSISQYSSLTSDVMTMMSLKYCSFICIKHIYFQAEKLYQQARAEISQVKTVVK